MNDRLLSLTGDIVAAHVSNNSVAVSDVPNLIRSVYGTMQHIVEPLVTDAKTISEQPKVSIRASVKPDAITCMLCGKKQKMLKRHLTTAHGLSPESYRNMFGLLPEYPMTAPNYSEERRQLAKSIGLGTTGHRRGTKIAA